METKWATMLENDHRIVVDLKEKQTSQCAVCLVGARRVLPQGSGNPMSNPSLRRLGKSKRSNACQTTSTSFLKNYSNFMNSGLPKRFLFLEEGKWKDFPEVVVQLISEHFRMKNAAIKVEFNGCELVLDVLYMIQLDVATGLQRPIAWVDDADCSFYPEVDGGTSDCSEPGRGSGPTVDIKLALDIGITGSKLEDCVEESNAQSKRIRIEQNHATGHKDFKSHNNSVAKHGSLDSDTVRNMFIRVTCSNVNILEIKHCSGDLVQSRLELFQKQIEITTNYRGDANVKYAWLPVTGEALPGIMMYGLGYCKPGIMPAYGIGINLVPTNCADISASYYDNDENGVRYVAFCRVILGNVELVHPGSKQCHPSCKDFDGGVDDLQNPTRFIVWSMNMNTHIFPEYVISYMSPTAKGGKQGKIDLSGVTTSQELQDQESQVDCSPTESGRNCQSFALVGKSSEEIAVKHGLCTSRTPKSPWMPFPLLLEAISKQVAPGSMHLVNVHYNLFRSKKISRDDFIVKLRSLVGNSLLKTTILSLQHNKMPPESLK